MLKTSVCTDALFPRISSDIAFRYVAEQGAQAVEIWGWWNHDVDALKRALTQYGLSMTAICTRFVTLLDSRCLLEYRQGLCETLSVCEALNCHQIITQVGAYRTDVPREMQREQLIDGLTSASDMLRGTGVTLLVEPLNTRVDHPGYFLTSSDECVEILRAVDCPQVKMLFDLYHQQISEGDVASRLRADLPWIGHVHMAGVPGRGSLWSGELSYAYLLSYLSSLGYSGYCGLELMTDMPQQEIRRLVDAAARL